MLPKLWIQKGVIIEIRKYFDQIMRKYECLKSCGMQLKEYLDGN